jgi:hypothetical protein
MRQATDSARFTLKAGKLGSRVAAPSSLLMIATGELFVGSPSQKTIDIGFLTARRSLERLIGYERQTGVSPALLQPPRSHLGRRPATQLNPHENTSTIYLSMGVPCCRVTKSKLLPKVLATSPKSLVCPFCKAKPSRDCATSSAGFSIIHLARIKAAASVDNKRKRAADKRAQTNSVKST